MPVPIKLNNQNGQNNDTSNKLLVDYSFLGSLGIPQSNRNVFASNNDAGLLMELWQESNEGVLEVPKTLSQKDLNRLKITGFVNVTANNMSFTDKAKKIIVTMTLAENNKFLKNQKSKSYTEILSSMDKRGKRGYRIAFSNNGLIRLS